MENSISLRKSSKVNQSEIPLEKDGAMKVQKMQILLKICTLS